MLLDAWYLFRRFRMTVFVTATILSLAWTILLSVYLSRIWSHSSGIQRSAVLAMIGVHFFSTIMLYLMVVVVFKFWLDAGRMLFLASIHTGTTVFYMLLSPGYSCVIFSSQGLCDVARLVILVNAWVTVGLFVTYTIVLLAMGHIPQPLSSGDVAFPSEKKPRDIPGLHSTRSLSITSFTNLLDESPRLEIPNNPPIWTAPSSAQPVQVPRGNIHRAINNPKPISHIRAPSPARSAPSVVSTSRPPSYSIAGGVASDYPFARLGSLDSQDPPALNRLPDGQGLTAPRSTYQVTGTYGPPLSMCPRWTTFTVEEYEHSTGGRPALVNQMGLLQAYHDVPARLQPGFMLNSRPNISHSHSVRASTYSFSSPHSSTRSLSPAIRPSTPGRSSMVQGLPASPRPPPRPLQLTSSTRFVHWAQPLTPDSASTGGVPPQGTARRPPSAHVRATSVPLPSWTDSVTLNIHANAPSSSDAGMPNPYSLPNNSAIQREASSLSTQSSGSVYSADSAPRDGTVPYISG